MTAFGGKLATYGAALVTGAGARLGKAIAIGLAEAGWDVVIHYRHSGDAAEAVAEEVRAHGRKADTLAADLAVDSDLEALVPRAAAIRPLAALINSASMFEEDAFDSMTPESWRAHMQTNLYAPIRLAQAFSAQLSEDARGAIVNLIDQRVLKPTPQFFSYALSKAALHAATQTMAQAAAPRVRVNAVGPGPSIRNARQSDADFARQVDATLTGEPSNPDRIVEAVRYLLDAESVTGQMIAVDSGQHLIWRTPDVDGVRE